MGHALYDCVSMFYLCVHAAWSVLIVLHFWYRPRNRCFPPSPLFGQISYDVLLNIDRSNALCIYSNIARNVLFTSLPLAGHGLATGHLVVLESG